MNRQTIAGIILGVANLAAILIARLLVQDAWFWIWLPFAILFATTYITRSNCESKHRNAA